MAMNVGPADGDEDEVVSAINTTPLVDVMLVLLIIFLITIPVVTTSIPVAAAEGAQRDPRDQAGEHRALRRRARAASTGTTCGSPSNDGADRAAEEDRGARPAARGADPRRRRRRLRRVGRDHLRRASARASPRSASSPSRRCAAADAAPRSRRNAAWA